MSRLLDCSTCGGLIPAGRRCCPHCHCKSSAWRRWALAASAALSLGSANCNSHPEPVVEYGPGPQLDLSGVDESVPIDQAEPPDLGDTDH